MKSGRLGGGTIRIVAESRRPGILGYFTGERPVGVPGDSMTGERVDTRPSSGSRGASSSNGPPPEEEVWMVVVEPAEAFESDRLGAVRPELPVL